MFIGMSVMSTVLCFFSMFKLELIVWHGLSSGRSTRADVKEKEMFASVRTKKKKSEKIERIRNKNC